MHIHLKNTGTPIFQQIIIILYYKAKTKQGLYNTMKMQNQTYFKSEQLYDQYIFSSSIIRSSNVFAYNEMKKANELLKPEKKIKIPAQFLKKLDKVSLLQLRETQQHFRKQSLHPKFALPLQNRKSSAFLQYNPQSDRQAYTSLKSNDKRQDSREKSSKIRFRTSGAGFRQRLRQASKQKNVKRHVQIINRSPNKKRQQSEDQEKFQQFAFKEVINKPNQTRIKRLNKPMKRIYFGQLFNFKQKGQFQYDQTFSEEDFEWHQQSINYKQIGFGIDNNLTRFDFQSLEDPEGMLFLSQFKGKTGYCPYFKDKAYIWIKVQVLGFDNVKKEVIVQRLGQNDVKNVSRLSIKFGADIQKQKNYWKRISRAKNIRRKIKEEQKYLRYITQRKQQFDMQKLANLRFNPKNNQQIQTKWFIPYCKQFLIYKEMRLKPQKYQSMGIQIRQYTPFVQIPIVKSMPDYKQNQETISNKHYSKFNKFPQTLYKLFERLNQQSCLCINTTVQLCLIEQLIDQQCSLIETVCSNIRLKVREFLLSDIYGVLAFAFKNKVEQKRYIKIHNFIFKDLIIKYLYEMNVQKWLDFISYFQTWTINTPNAIIKMSLRVERNSKQIIIQPSLQRTIDLLNEPVNYLQKSLQQIPDILSELLGGSPTRVTIKQSLKSAARQIIEKIVRFSFLSVNHYCQNFKGKLKYLQKINYQNQQFSQTGKRQYINSLQQLSSDIKEANNALIFRSGLFNVDASDLKQTIRSSIIKQKNRLGKLIQKQIQQEVFEMTRKFKEKEEYLKIVPRDQQQLVKMREYLRNDCQSFLDEAYEHYKLCLSFLQIFEDYFIQLNFRQYQEANQTVMQHSHLINLINCKLTQLSNLEQLMIEAINNQRDNILKQLQDLAPKIAVISKYSQLALLSECYVFTSRTYHELETIEKQLESVNHRQRVLSQEISIFPVINKMERELRPYFDVWNNAYIINSLLESINQDPICELKYEYLYEKVTQLSKQQQRLSSLFVSTKNPSALGICQGLSEKISFVQNKLWIIKAFTLQGIVKKEGIRKQILSTIFKDKQVKFSQINLQTLMTGNIEIHKEFVIKNAQKAQRIWQLQQKISGIVNQVKKLQFQFTKNNQLPFVEENVLLSLSCAVHEQIEVMEAIKDLEQASYLTKKVNSIFSKLVNIEETLLSMIKFQEVFFPIVQLLKIQELGKQMGKEGATFLEVEKLWKNMCNHFLKDVQLWEAIQTDSYRNRLENGLGLLEIVDRRLTEAIDKKRHCFPRLFFVPHSLFRNLLLDDSLLFSSQIMPFLFGGIKKFIYRGDNYINGFIGWDNQQVQFKKTLSRSVVWQYLRFVQQQMSKIMQWQLNFKSNKTQKYIFSKATKILCQYTYFIQQAIANNKLKKLLGKITKQIEQLSLQSSYENTIYTSHLIIMRDKASALQNSNTYESSQFEWRKQLKYFITEGGGVQLKTFHVSLTFKDQYTGNFIRPLAFIGEKACFQSIILAWNMNSGLMIDRNSLETVKQICGTTMRHYVGYKIHQNTLQQDIIYSLRGYFCSSTWLSLESIGPISKEAFEIIAQAAFEVHSAVQKQRTLFYLGGEPMNIERGFRFNLFIGLQTAMSKEVPTFLPLQNRKGQLTNTKFGIAFRTFSWITPSQMIISKFKLQSFGLERKQVKQIMNLFQLLLVQNGRSWYQQSFAKIIDRAAQKILTTAKQQIYQVIRDELWVGLSHDKIGQITKSMKFPSTNLINLESVIQQIQSGRGCFKNQILLLGNPLSGKDYLCKQSFKRLNLQIEQTLQYDPKLANQWQYLSFSLYSKNIPSSQKMVVRGYHTDSLDPVQISQFIVYYHKDKLNWKTIAQGKLKYLKINNQIKIQALRQMEILFSLEGFLKQEHQQASLKIAFTLSFLKFLQIFIIAHKIKSLGQIPRTQLIFMLIYWQSYTFFPKTTLNPSNFGSNLDKQPINYYFEIQKSAWIEWTTLPLQYFNKNAEFINELFLPIKQSVSFIYFFANMVPFTNIWIQAQKSGIGLHKTIQRSVKKGLLQFYKAHKNIDYEAISNLITYNIAIFKKQGKYFPKLNQSLVICIEDVNLPNTPQFGTFLNALLNNSYEKNKKRVLAKSSFICTSSGSTQLSRQFLGIAKNTVKMNVLNPCQQSKSTIYNYYLEWFFGNTENPFSKEVRNATQLIVKLSLFIQKEASLYQNNGIRFCHIVKIYQGLCQCSPKSVKATQQILQLWLQQYQNQFSAEKISLKENIFPKKIMESFLQNQKGLDKKLVNLMKSIIEKDTPIFIRLPSLQLQYSQTYRRVPKQLLISHLHKLIQTLDYKKFSYFPLIIFESLIDHIVKVIRVINIPERHLLIYGFKSSGKVTIARIASFLVCEKDTNIIRSCSAWKDQVGRYLNQIKKEAKPKSLIFKLKSSDSQQFMMTIEEILYLSHPRSLIFDKNSRYLQNLNISSSNSQQYKDFKQLSQRYLHCLITYPSLNLKQLYQKYPYMLRKVQFMNVQSSYEKNGPQQICKASIGKYFTDFSLLQKANQIFIRNGIPMNQGKLIKISQMTLSNFERCIRFVQSEQKRYKQSIEKIRLTEKQKLELEKELESNSRLLAKLSIRVQELRKDYKQFEQQYQDKVKDYNEHNEQCEIQRGKTEEKRQQVQNELNKVLPMLKAAEDAMAKVTRDDINQLRSFPNPPLPAAKVVQSLIFLFNESQLVKEKVLQDGRKIRDFWQYAKKFILNDRLLKRVEDFKPDTIKNLDQNIVETLKQIIKKPEFLQQRVFKASVAAGNLSLWIRAILAVYDVMQLIQPKKKLLNQAQQALRQREELLRNQLDQLNRFHVILMEKKKNYELKLEQKDKIQSKIMQLQHFIANGKQILAHLQPREKQWRFQIEQKLKNLLKYCQEESLLAAIQINILASLSYEQKFKITKELFHIFTQKEIFKKTKYKFTCLRHYQQNFNKLCFNQQKCQYFSLNHLFSQSIICFHELIAINQPITIIIDKTYQFLPYLSFSSIPKMYSFKIKIIDCLQFKQFQDAFTLQKKYSDDEVQSDEQNKINTQNDQRNILIITNICHRPNFMVHFNNIPKMYGDHQLIFLQNELNSDFTNLLNQQQLQISIIFENTEDLNGYFLKQKFDINLEELQEIQESVYNNRVRNKIIDLFCSVKNIILSQENHQEWISNNNEEIMIRKNQKGYKKSGKVIDEKVKQILDLISSKRTINLPKHLELIKQYFDSLSQSTQRSLFNYLNWLKDRLCKWPQTLIKIISANYQTTNPLAYYLLKFGKMEELQKSISLQNKKKQSQQTPMGKILNLQYQIIDPHSLLHVLNKNLNAFICITDKYKLKKALQQCKIIEEAYKTEYIEEFLEREEFSYIYLISQCGSFYVEELSELKQSTLKQAITYGEWKEGKFNEAYQLQCLHRKYQMITPKDKMYFQAELFNKPLIAHTQMFSLYSSRQKIRQLQKNEGKYISKIKLTKQNGGQFQLGCYYIQFLHSGSNSELTLWEIEELVFRQYFK